MLVTKRCPSSRALAPHSLSSLLLSAFAFPSPVMQGQLSVETGGCEGGSCLCWFQSCLCPSLPAPPCSRDCPHLSACLCVHVPRSLYLHFCLRRAGCASVPACLCACLPPHCYYSLPCAYHALHSPFITDTSEPSRPDSSCPLPRLLPPSLLPQCYSGMTHQGPLPSPSPPDGIGKAGVSLVSGGRRRWVKEEVWKRRAGLGPLWMSWDTCPHFHLRLSLTQAPSHSLFQIFSEAQQLQPLQVYQAPLSLATVPHQALSRTQSSPASAGSMKSPPDQPTKHLFTTGEPLPPTAALAAAPGALCMACSLLAS